MTDFSARAVTKATARLVIVRACTVCQHPRVQGEPCAGCGNPEPPVVQDLGVQSYYHASPLRRLAWWAVGSRLAARRAKAASRYVTG